MNLHKDDCIKRYVITLYTPEIQLNWTLWKTNAKNMDYSNMLCGLKRLIVEMKKDKYCNVRLFGCEGYSEVISDIYVDSEFIRHEVSFDGFVSDTKISKLIYGEQFLKHIETIYDELKIQIPKKDLEYLENFPII